MKLPRIIVLGGGGVKAIAHIGALQALEDRKLLSLVRQYVGLSAGSLVAFGLYLGYSLAALKNICEQFDFAILQEPAPEGFLSFLDNYGIDTGDKLVRFLQALLTVKGLSPDITFNGLASRINPQKSLSVVASNLSTGSPIIFSFKNTPDMKVVDALRASMSFPFYFWPVRVGDELLVDGGVHGMYPMNLLTFEEQEDALGIILLQQIDSWNHFDGPDGFVLRLYEITSHSKSSLLYDRYKDNTIRVNTPPIGTLKFALSAEERRQLYEAGYSAAINYIELQSKTRCMTIRRNSI